MILALVLKINNVILCTYLHLNFIFLLLNCNICQLNTMQCMLSCQNELGTKTTYFKCMIYLLKCQSGGDRIVFLQYSDYSINAYVIKKKAFKTLSIHVNCFEGICYIYIRCLNTAKPDLCGFQIGCIVGICIDFSRSREIGILDIRRGNSHPSHWQVGTLTSAGFKLGMHKI